VALRPLYSIQIISVAPCLPLSQVVVPDGSVIVLRDVDVVEASGGGAGIFQILSASGGIMWSVQRGAGIAGAVFQWRGRQVFHAGEVITFQVVSGVWDVQASGYELSVP
jgi:hypothetical protein